MTGETRKGGERKGQAHGGEEKEMREELRMEMRSKER